MNKVKTGNQVFDAISNFYEGYMILVLDEGHYESLQFLSRVFSNVAQTKKVIAIAPYDIIINLEQIRLDPSIKSTSGLSIFISQLRDKIGEGVLIHHYIPQILVQHGEAPVLKMIEHWVSKIHRQPFLEFITLPRNTFLTFERTIQTLLPGTINLNIVKSDEEYYRTFNIHRACDIRYHGVDFPYIIKDDKLLIKFEGEYTDKIPATDEEKIEKKKAYLTDNINKLEVFLGKIEPNRFLPQDYILLSQLHKTRLSDLKLMFPERFDELLDKISRWIIDGIVEVEETKAREEKPVKKLGLRAQVALKLPNWIAIGLLGKSPRRVPREALNGLRRTIEVILHTYLPEKKEPFEVFASTERFLQEIAGRGAAIKRLKVAGEDPRVKLDLRYLPKIISLTLYVGFRLRCKIDTVSSDIWEVKIKECFVCEDVKSDKPACHIISGTLAGGLSQSFKEKITCDEIRCKSLGDRECTFIVRRI